MKLLIIFFVYISLNFSNFLQKITSNTEKKTNFQNSHKVNKTTGEYCFTLQFEVANTVVQKRELKRAGGNFGKEQMCLGASLVAQLVKSPSANTGDKTWVPSLDQEDPLEKEMATHSSILSWKIPWTEEPAGYSPQGCKSQTRLSAIFLSFSKRKAQALESDLSSASCL